MADTIFTSQTPATNDFDGSPHHWGMKFTVSANCNCTGGRAWVPTAGRPTTFWWQLWRISDAALLADSNLNGAGHGSPSSAAWMSFTSSLFTTPGSIALSSSETYVVNVYFTGGNGVYTDDGTETFPVGSGGLLSSSTGRFINGAAQATMPTTDYAAYFFADVNAETAPAARRAVHRPSRPRPIRRPRFGPILLRPAVDPALIPTSPPTVWLAGPPEPKWAAGAPESKWSAAPPESKWSAGPPERG